jgi:SagB-type dehydrogenase family enzyme
MHAEPTDHIPARLRLLSLSEDVLVEVGPDGEHLVAFSRWGEIRIDDTSPVVRESLRRMNFGPVSVENLPVAESFQLRKSGETGESREQPWARLERVLDRLGNCVVRSLGLEGEAGPVLSVAPVSRHARFWLPSQVEPERPIKLSRFAALRPGSDELLLESPLTPYRVVLHRPIAAWVVGSLGSPTTITDLSALLRIPEPVVADIVAYLAGGGMVLTGEYAAPLTFAEDGDPDLVPWSHHDLHFHAATRMGRNGDHTGAVFPYADRLPAAPVTKPRPDGARFELHRPVLADLVDPSLTEVIEVPTSDGDYSELPLAAEQLGELLFRTARIRETRLASAPGGVGFAISDRPYLSTDGLYELELYLSIDRCSGLPRGIYHYDPGEHVLTLFSDSESDLSELLDNAKVAAGSTLRPPVLITMTSRIARLSWVYTGIAYSATLTHVGALHQTLHLVATAMGLAARPLAVGDASIADEALRLPWPTEVSIAELIVGLRP